MLMFLSTNNINLNDLDGFLDLNLDLVPRIVIMRCAQYGSIDSVSSCVSYLPYHCPCEFPFHGAETKFLLYWVIKFGLVIPNPDIPSSCLFKIFLKARIFPLHFDRVIQISTHLFQIFFDLEFLNVNGNLST